MEITDLLQRVHCGDGDALQTLMPLVYDELRKLAAGHLRREKGNAQRIETTALVHEAFLRLAKGRHPSYENRAHFYGIASRLMRQVLVDTVRASSRDKRSALEEVQMADFPDPRGEPDNFLLELDGALERLGRNDARKIRLLEMRFFGGMTAEESARALAISVHTVRRELRLAQAWLHKELSG
jgi:RNA polymerase sigma-70 factor, ECF subfamily